MGWDHIFDVHAMDHLLFITSLVSAYRLDRWKYILILVTAFTLGHAVSLIAVTLGVRVPSEWVEFLIPCTILTMAVYHLFQKKESKLTYQLATLFGLIHGTAYAQGFAELFQDIPGFLTASLGFNLGVEGAQIAFAMMVLVLAELLLATKVLDQKSWRGIIFGAVVALTIPILISNIPW
jgi:uncharacterized membrane protein YfcA